MAQARDPRVGLVRAIGRWDLTAAVVNAVIGSSIFGMPARLAELVGSGAPLAYVFAGLGILTIVLCFAEVASRFRDAGGPYLYAREAFGSLVGFEAGWLTFWIRVTAAAANLNVFAEYLGQIVPQAAAGPGRLLTMGALLGLITIINLVGVRPATWTVDFFTLAKLLPLAMLVAVGLPRVTGAILATQGVARPAWNEAILLLVFAYGGFESPLIPAGEAKDPRRDTAFALFVALAVIATAYCLVQLVVIGVVPHVAGTKAPVAAAMSALLGPVGVSLASAAAMVSIYGYTTGTVLQSPRVLFSMAERGELPQIFARVHPSFRTPDVAIFTYSVLAFGLAAWGSFEWNATLSAIVRLVTYGLTCAALLVLRARRPDEAPGFRLPGASAVAPAAVLFCLWLLTTRTLAQGWILGLILLTGALLWGKAARRTMARPA
jgi:APA family basic amino acid/polyamine antiporter